MAKVVLPFEKYKEVAPLPPVCIRCGKPATRFLKMEFNGRTTRILGIRIYAPGGGLDSVEVGVPLCDGHPFMGMAKWMFILGFLILLPFFVLGALLRPWIHLNLFLYPLVALMVVGFAFTVYVLLTSIDGEGFDEDGVYAVRVSPKFVRALEDHEWTADEVVARMRKHRKGRVKPERPFWISPFFYVPVSVAAAFVVFTPIGCLVASREPPGGPWPAGMWAARAPEGGGPGQPLPGGQPQPVPANRPEPFNPKSFGGLVGYWPLDDGQGNAAQDVSGHGILAILHGGEWVPGVRGTALRLDGVSNYLDIGPADGRLSFRAGAPFTVACWVNTTADTGVISSFRRHGNARPAVDLLVKDGKLRGWVRDDTNNRGAAIPVGGQVNDGKWHHVALVRQADGTVELYNDGAFQAKDRGTNSAGPITTDMHTLGSERFMVEMGKKGPTYFAGAIDEFCVFDRALSAEELTILMGGKK